MYRESHVSSCSTETSSSNEPIIKIPFTHGHSSRGRDRMTELQVAGIPHPHGNKYTDIRTLEGSGLQVAAILDLISEVNETLQTLPHDLDQLVSLQERASDTRIHEAVLEKNRHNLNRASFKLQTRLVKFKDDFQAIEAKIDALPKRSADHTMCFNQLAVLRRRHLKCVKKFHEVEKAYSEKQKARLLKELRVVHPHATEADLDNLSSTRSREKLFRATQSGYEALSFVHSRHKEIQRVEETVEEIAQLFQELSLLIEEQESLVNAAGEHVDSSVEKIEMGGVQVTKAIRRRKATICMCWIFWTIIVLVLVGVGIYLGVSNTKSGSETPAQAKVSPPLVPVDRVSVKTITPEPEPPKNNATAGRNNLPQAGPILPQGEVRPVPLTGNIARGSNLAPPTPASPSAAPSAAPVVDRPRSTRTNSQRAPLELTNSPSVPLNPPSQTVQPSPRGSSTRAARALPQPNLAPTIRVLNPIQEQVRIQTTPVVKENTSPVQEKVATPAESTKPDNATDVPTSAPEKKSV